MHWITRTAVAAATTLALTVPAMGIAQAAPASNTGPQTAALAAQDCPSGWLCLYEHTNYKGRMLKFKENRWQQLSAFGFNDKASSWKNRLGRDACLSWNWPAGDRRISLASGGSSTQLGSWNDEASGVKPGRC
ncbi:MAG: peptidase inhibitor family I36 protein [Pseudonocardiaceae bacterium]